LRALIFKPLLGEDKNRFHTTPKLIYFPSIGRFPWKMSSVINGLFWPGDVNPEQM
jgi:hypothetical protein